MKRYAYSIFADDIRQENNGKIFYIGTYLNVMKVPKFPFTLPTFSIATTIVSSPEKPFNSLKIKYYFGDSIREETVPNDFLKNLPQPLSQGYLKATVFKVFPLITIDKETTLKVIADVDGEEIYADSLQISQT